MIRSVDRPAHIAVLRNKSSDTVFDFLRDLMRESVRTKLTALNTFRLVPAAGTYSSCEISPTFLRVLERAIFG